MLDILATERMKLRRNRLILVCTILATFLPIFMIWYSGYVTGGAMPDNDLISWVAGYSRMYQLIVYPVLSGLILTFLLQREYGDQTLINSLTAPVSRTKLLLGKIIVWAAWHTAITAIFLVIMCAAAGIFYGSTYLFDNLIEIVKLVIKLGLLNLGTLTPVIWVAVLQRKTFYPSLVCTMVFIGIGFMGLYGPKILGSILPWVAVMFMSVGMEIIPGLAYTCIALCFVFGIFMSIYSFRRQDL